MIALHLGRRLRLKPAAPSVDRAVVWIDTVKRGPMLRQVRGSGTLVPEDIRWLPAQTSGRVERILLRSGAQVTPDSVILELSNPELTQTVTEAQLAYQSALAAFENRKAELQSGLLSQEADTANIEALYKQAALDLEANESLFKEGLISELTLKQKRGATEELKNRLALAQRRLEISRLGVKSQVAPQEADVNQKKTAWELRRKQLEDLKVKAGMEGVLQCVCSNPTTQLERGSSVTPGTQSRARRQPLTPEGGAAGSRKRRPRTSASASTPRSTHATESSKGTSHAWTRRRRAGTVGVDVSMDGPLPPGARPDLSVDGTIQLEKLDNIINVGRPAFGQENSTVSIFKVLPSGEAISTPVKLGRASVNTIEIVEGLQPGDQVILSDMSQYDSFNRVQLEVG